MREMKWPVDEFDWHVYAEYPEIKMRDKYTCVTIFPCGTQFLSVPNDTLLTLHRSKTFRPLPEEFYEGLKAELSACKWFQVKCLFHFTVTSWEDERSPSSG